MWDAPPWTRDVSTKDRTGRIATGAEAKLIKAAVSGFMGCIEREEEFKELQMMEEMGTSFETYPFRQMTTEQILWFGASMVASMLQKDVPKVTVNVMTESFLYELIKVLEADLDETELYADQVGELLLDFVGRTFIDEETDEEIERTPKDCIDALEEGLWLEENDFAHYDMQNRENDDPVHLLMGTSTEYYNMIARIPTEEQVNQSRKYLSKIADQGYLLKDMNVPVIDEKS